MIRIVLTRLCGAFVIGLGMSIIRHGSPCDWMPNVLGAVLIISGYKISKYKYKRNEI